MLRTNVATSKLVRDVFNDHLGEVFDDEGDVLIVTENLATSRGDAELAADDAAVVSDPHARRGGRRPRPWRAAGVVAGRAGGLARPGQRGPVPEGAHRPGASPAAAGHRPRSAGDAGLCGHLRTAVTVASHPGPTVACQPAHGTAWMAGSRARPPG